MKKRLIVVDFDGTICNDKKKVTARTKKAIADFQAQGGIVVIATTRPYDGIKDKARLMGLNGLIITNQGAIIHDLKDNSIFYENRLPLEKTIKIINFVSKYNDTIYALSENKILSYKASVVDKILQNFIGVPIKKEKGDLVNNENLVKTAQIVSSHIKESKIKEIFELGLKEFPDLAVGRCDKLSVNFTQKEVSKGKAIEIVANFYGIPKEEIISFGDSDNDASMFDFSGTGVAMANSMDYLKSIATYICDSNENDGVAKEIEKIIAGTL